MLPNLQHYHRPRSLAEAVTLLKKDPESVALLAGGTYLVPSGRREITEVVDIAHLGLNFITRAQDALCIGATTPLQDIMDSETVRGWARGILAEACRVTTVSRMRRNVSTIGGEIVTADPASGVPVVLLALDARVKMVDDTERDVALNEFYEDDARLRWRGGIITEIVIPEPNPTTRMAFLSLGQIPSSLPIVRLAASLDLDDQAVCRRARIALSAATAKPVRVPSAEALLIGSRLDAQAIDAVAQEVAASVNPVSDPRGSAAYRRQMSRVLARRALASIANGQENCGT